MKNTGRKGILLKTMVLLGLRIFLLVEAAPALNFKNWNEGDLSPIISPPCFTNEPCSSWLPVTDEPSSPFIYQEDPEMQAQRIQTIRGVDSAPIWQETSENFETLDRTIPVSSSFPSRLSKKDVFMSRGWGAGGMPFSVLYMSPHNSRNNHGTSGLNPGEAQKSEPPNRNAEMIPIPSKNTQPNYRVALRNGSSGQTRRQYSIIPQLFISYGWGPSGK